MIDGDSSLMKVEDISTADINNKTNNEKFSLEFDDIVLEVVNKDVGSSMYRKRLINGVSGKFESGKVTAVMGPSGSCKTTLIDLLSGRVESGSMSHGRVTYKGKERATKQWLSEIAYLEQDHCTFSQQTVYQYIRDSLQLRNNGKSSKELELIISNMMVQFELDKIQNVLMSAISGGERKRVMIAVEIALEREVIFLDEPTSGLDSHLSLELVSMLKEYASKKNKIVVMTVHQPRSGLFELFDDLIFLYKGVAIYQGPATSVDGFFESKGMRKPAVSFQIRISL